jgi:hypothetical protein
LFAAGVLDMSREMPSVLLGSLSIPTIPVKRIVINCEIWAIQPLERTPHLSRKEVINLYRHYNILPPAVDQNYTKIMAAFENIDAARKQSFFLKIKHWPQVPVHQ